MTSDKTTPKAMAKKASGVGFPIVGIGASAGGLEAFEHFFLPTDPGCGIAFVLVSHLDPDHVSILTEILQRMTVMPVLYLHGAALGLTVNAQGVESEAQNTFLATQRCDNFQGYLINHPLGPDEFEKFLVFKNGP